jgi:hypothetical protein
MPGREHTKLIVAPPFAGKSFACRCFNAGTDFDLAYSAELHDVFEQTQGRTGRKAFAMSEAAASLMLDAFAANGRLLRLPLFTGLIDPARRLLHAGMIDSRDITVWLPGRSSTDRTMYEGFARSERLIVSLLGDLSDTFEMLTEVPL